MRQIGHVARGIHFRISSVYLFDETLTSWYNCKKNFLKQEKASYLERQH